MKKTIEEVRDYLLENRVDEGGDLMLSGLDFSDIDGDVYIGGMKVQGNLRQDSQEVEGNLYQHSQEVQGDLYQDNHEVQGDLYQRGHEVKGNLIHGDSKYGGKLFEYPYSKLLKKITADELKEMGYELVK